MTNVLLVRIDDDVVGRLWLDAKKRFCFQYDMNWLDHSKIPLSLSLPLQPAPYLDDESHPFFANLLPEEKIRAVIARNLGVSLNNDLGFWSGSVAIVPVRFHSFPRPEKRNAKPAAIAGSRWMN